MTTNEFEFLQLLKAYRGGLITEQLFEQRVSELARDNQNNPLQVQSVFMHRGNEAKVSAHVMGKTPQTESMVFSLPANFSNDRENSHKGDQIIYVIEGRATARVAGAEQEIKAGDIVTIPAGAMHSLRTASEPLFAFTIFAPPEA
jgi:quercetin dioxygenase-like cupin family protein